MLLGHQGTRVTSSVPHRGCQLCGLGSDVMQNSVGAINIHSLLPSFIHSLDNTVELSPCASGCCPGLRVKVIIKTEKKKNPFLVELTF